MSINTENIIITNSFSNCYLCDSKGVTLYSGLVDRLYGVPGDWDMIKCSNSDCGLLWLEPMPKIEDIPELYKKYYTHTISKPMPTYLNNIYERIREGVLASYFGYKEATNSMVWLILGRILGLFPLLRERIGGTVMWLKASQRGRLLEVGCGGGKQLQRLHKLGWNVVGIEPDNEAAGFVRTNFGLDVRSCSLEEAKLPDASFDVIIMHHVIEHLYDPLKTLRECERILQKKGLLVVVTPNAMSSGIKRYGQDWRGFEVPRHLHLFTPRAFKYAIIDAGFLVKSMKTLVSRGGLVWINSDSIRKDRHCKMIGQKVGGTSKRRSETAKRWLKLFRYQVFQSILLWSNSNSGEEILVVARKP